MPNTLDVSQHCLLWHNTELVDVHKVGFANGEATDTKYKVKNALRRSLDQRDLVANELSAAVVACVFNIPAIQLPSKLELKRNDFIEANDGNWTILSASLLTFKTRWRCVCVRQEK